MGGIAHAQCILKEFLHNSSYYIRRFEKKTDDTALNFVTRWFSGSLSRLVGLVFDIDHSEGLKLRDEGAKLKKFKYR